MRALIQRVSGASVTIDEKKVGEISEGLVILLGVTHDDNDKDVDYLAEKCINLRIFRDDEDRMNRSLLDVNGEALIVSQFTLYGDTRKGRRPSFIDAALPDHAIPLYENFIKAVKNRGITVETGEFGADMSVDIKNHGPVTLMVESKK
ncbi:MAG: D-tyrosyl-tRNA(Tyr) deacylase [Lentisphaerae bacterium]|nr:D-tyrosyl-tRNA(Tyr) deacylase [Lentisphaerota bacterium]MCP4100942.1 D-tyrosyl-tRNA(Tyr) deacylase [Lentisphaerota bacterium]